MRIIDRFDKYMDFKGLNDNRITVQLGLSVGLLGKARKEGADLGKQTIQKILNLYQDINRVWLLTGEGEMLKTNDTQQNVFVGRDAIGNVNGNVSGNGHNIGIIPADCERDLIRAKAEIDILKRKIKEIEAQHKQEKEILNRMLDQAITDKDKAMSMLEKALSR